MSATLEGCHFCQLSLEPQGILMLTLQGAFRSLSLLTASPSPLSVGAEF